MITLPIGPIKKPAAKTPKVINIAVYLLKLGKNTLAITGVKYAKSIKSYHSTMVLAEAKKTCLFEKRFIYYK
ncbi:hypothetical protein fsci_17540 [Francisella sciaenopsi]|uniref:Uncharacterized protein n=1 Tax=Francisella sciaenopsi TaxID=3055034 RepID=A0ABQ6PIL3_9GAMM